MAPWGRATRHLQERDTKNAKKRRNQLSRPRQDDYKTGKVKVMHTKTKTNTEPPQTMGGA